MSFHSLIRLPEHHQNYKAKWASKCGSWRVVRCQDNEQDILQSYESPRWRSKSYHVEYASLVRRWKNIIPDLPDRLD